jgi:phosphoribosyl 1,2-cyclic phosphate phosphodiesterase
MKMRVTVLGCGGSAGVPMAGNVWGRCDPKEPRNYRRRTSILVQQGETTILVDTAPELREQLNANNVGRLDAVLFTHGHADHVNGIDDLRPIYFAMGRPIDTYAEAPLLREIEERFPYMVGRVSGDSVYSRPFLRLNELTPRMNIGGLDFACFPQDHTVCTSYGFRFGGIGYSTDAAQLDDNAFAKLAGIDVWIVAAVRREPHPAHAHLDRVLEWIERVKPKRSYLTHMNHTMDYRTLLRELPPGVEPAYDGLVVETE